MNTEIDYNNAPYNTINTSEDNSYNPLQSLVNSYLNPKTLGLYGENKTSTTEKTELEGINIKSKNNYVESSTLETEKYNNQESKQVYNEDATSPEKLSMYDNRGKYFDQVLFNKKFEGYIEEKNKERLLKQKVKAQDLDNVENIVVKPYQLPLNKILINTKNTWFDIYDNITTGTSILGDYNDTNGKNELNNKLFYIGITLIFVTILYILLSFIFT
jgi:hypothetical protein